MRIETDIKLGFKDVMFRPKRSTLKSRSQVALERTFKFMHTDHEWTGVPIIAANMDNIAKDIAMATGESLATLAELMQVAPENRGAFNTLLQKNFGRIFTSENVTDTEVLDNISDVTGLI